MGALELFLHDRPESTPTLLKTALTHVQFETIHPFLDGNGRLGRLLITLLLCEQKALQEMGFSRVYNVKEGMSGSGAGPGWVRRGLPVDSCQTC